MNNSAEKILPFIFCYMILAHSNQVIFLNIHKKRYSKWSRWYEKMIVGIKLMKTNMHFSVCNATIFAWCEKTSSNVKFYSQHIFSPGWFFGISPHNFNPLHFETYIFGQTPYLQGDITIYMKEVWHWDGNKSKVSSEGVFYQWCTCSLAWNHQISIWAQKKWTVPPICNSYSVQN